MTIVNIKRETILQENSTHDYRIPIFAFTCGTFFQLRRGRQLTLALFSLVFTVRHDLGRRVEGPWRDESDFLIDDRFVDDDIAAAAHCSNGGERRDDSRVMTVNERKSRVYCCCSTVHFSDEKFLRKSRNCSKKTRSDVSHFQKPKRNSRAPHFLFDRAEYDESREDKDH